MLFALIGLFYARWFYKSALVCENRNPKLWAFIGFFVFFLTGVLSSLGISLFLMATQSGYDDTPGGLAIILILLSGVIIGNGCAFLFQPRSSSRRLSEAVRQVSARRDLALPGEFPLGFASFFLLTAVLGVVLGMALQAIILETHADTVSVFNGYMPTFLFEAAVLSYILQNHKNWRDISLRWGAIVPFVHLIKYLLSVAGMGFFYNPSLVFFVTQYITFFINAACITLSVQRWGASLPVLLCSSVLSKFLLTLLMILPELIYSPGIPFPFHLFMSIFMGAVLALCLYAGLLFHEWKAAPKS